MAVDIPAIREVVERVFARPDVLNACKRRDISTMITILGANGVTQAEIAALMGKTTQGRLSEYKMHKRIRPPCRRSRRSLMAWGCLRRRGLRLGSLLRLLTPALLMLPEDGRPICGRRAGGCAASLSNLSRASAVPVLSALREIHRGYIEADRLMGSICHCRPYPASDACRREGLRGYQGGGPDPDAPVRLPVHGVRRVDFSGCRGSDVCDAWTDRALDYALELGDRACYRLYAHAEGNDRDGKRGSCAGSGHRRRCS